MFYLNSFKCCHGSKDRSRNTLTFVHKERTFYGFSEIFISNIFDIHHNGNSLGNTASHNFCHHGTTSPEYWLHRQHHIYKLQLSWTFHILAFESADEKVSRLGTLWLGKGKYNSEYSACLWRKILICPLVNILQGFAPPLWQKISSWAENGWKILKISHF